MSACLPGPTHFIGCDVGKTSIVVHDTRDNRTYSIANRSDTLAALAETLDDTCLVICEPTGGHEDLLLDALVKASRPCHRADARKVKAYIRSVGVLGKTDAIDARLLARYGQERHATLVRWQAVNPQRERLQTLVTTRQDMVAQRVACSNRLSAPGAQAIELYLKPLLAALDTQISVIDLDIKALIKADEDLRRTTKTLTGIVGIGATTAAALQALMPELGTMNRRQAASLAGLAPHPQQSGAKDGYRRTRGGRPDIKRILFMAALSASRHNKELRVVYQRLIANAKKPMVALVAIMRKIIVIANAKLKEDAANNIHVVGAI